MQPIITWCVVCVGAFSLTHLVVCILPKARSFNPSNVETLQNSLEAAESRATQLAARLAIVEAEAAESAPRAQELSRWQVLMQRLQPGSNGPEALQRLVEGLQRDVASRAEAAATLQTKAAELQGMDIDMIMI